MAQSKSKSKSNAKIVIVRARDAGVHVGELVSYDGRQATLSNAHKIWRWRGANTLCELAANGAHMTEYTRISEAAPGQVVLTETCEIIDVAPAAVVNLTTPRWL